MSDAKWCCDGNADKTDHASDCQYHHLNWNPQVSAPAEPQGDALPTAIGDKFVIANGEMRFLAQAINRLDDVTDKPAAPQPDRLAAPPTDFVKKRDVLDWLKGYAGPDPDGFWGEFLDALIWRIENEPVQAEKVKEALQVVGPTSSNPHFDWKEYYEKVAEKLSRRPAQPHLAAFRALAEEWDKASYGIGIFKRCASELRDLIAQEEGSNRTEAEKGDG